MTQTNMIYRHFCMVLQLNYSSYIVTSHISQFTLHFSSVWIVQWMGYNEICTIRKYIFNVFVQIHKLSLSYFFLSFFPPPRELRR
jgi:hypothetical protein